jgi:DMSO/TMAO reductase YedYZ heme-binding membrane subunit
MASIFTSKVYMNGWNLTKWLVGLSILWFAVIFFKHGFHEEANRIAIRQSARIAAVLFSFAFGASALQRFWKNGFSNWLLKNRKNIGVAFAIVHIIHLIFLAVLQTNFHPVFEMAKTISILGGGLAYVFVFLMLLTSFPKFSQYLSPKNWKLLHTAGGYWIWYIFIRSYVKRVNTEIEYLPLVILLVVVFVLRIWKILKV